MKIVIFMKVAILGQYYDYISRLYAAKKLYLICNPLSFVNLELFIEVINYSSYNNEYCDIDLLLMLQKQIEGYDEDTQIS